WMTAGAGIVHSEMPSRRFMDEGGRMHGFQIWVNLPAALKMTQPRYQDVRAHQIPSVTTEDGRATVRVVAGEALGARAVIETHSPIVYQDWSVREGADVSVALLPTQTALVYVFEGDVSVGDGGRVVKDGELAVLAEGDSVRFRGTKTGGRLL